MTVDGLSSVMYWTLGFGRHAVPVSPPALVSGWKSEVKAMAARRKPPATRQRH